MGANNNPSFSYRFGPFSVDVPAGQLRKHGTKIRLAGQPFEILVMLLERAGEVVTREELQQRLWRNETFVDFENSLNKAINKLRQTLADSAEQPNYIETLPRRGYRFIFPLEDTLSSEFRTSADAKEVVNVHDSPSSSSRWITYAIAIGAATAIAFLLVNRWQKQNSETTIKSVAVLPLDYLSNEPGQEFLVEGITDELITQLAKSGAFRVTSRTSSMQYRKTRKGVGEIGKELGVDAVVEGSIERSGDHLRIRAQLVRTATDQHIWAESYDGAVSDLLSLEDRVAKDIATKVAINLTPDQQERFLHTHAVDAEAYQDYLRGRFFWNQRTAEAYTKALEYFQKAVDRDTGYAAAYAGLADTYLLLGGYGISSQNDAIPKAREAAKKALEREDLAEAHASLALIAVNYDWDWKTAEREYLRAIALNPNYATAHHWYGQAYLALVGRFDEAVSEMKRAQELDPLSPMIATDLGVTYYLARRYDDGIHEFERTLEMHPHFLFAEIHMARCYEKKNMNERAIAILENAQKHGDDFFLKEELGRLYAEAGRTKDAETILNDLRRTATSRFEDTTILNGVLIGLKRNDEALTGMQRGLEVHSTVLTSLKVNPIYDPLRSDPRFDELLRKVHLAE